MRALLSLLLVGIVSTQAFAGTDVNDVIAKHFEAKGGLAKMKALTTLVREGTMSMAQGMELNITETYKRKNKFRMDMNFQGANVIQAFDGTTGWSVNPMSGGKPEKQSAEESKEALERANFDSPLMDLKERGSKVELIGSEDIDGTTAYKLKITDKSGKDSFLYIDAASYLELRLDSKISMMGQEADVEMVFSNFQDVGGVQMPHVMEIRADGQTMVSMTYTSTKANVDVPDSRFAFPGEADEKKK